jgi:cytochrome c556
MKRVMAGARLLVVGLPALLAVTAGAEGERKLSIRAVMHKEYTVSRAPFLVIKKELDSEATDWEKVREAAGTFVTLAAALEKNDPGDGDKASWKKFTELHTGDVRAMGDAAEARDKDAARAVHRRLAAACNACHDAHRSRGRE